MTVQPANYWAEVSALAPPRDRWRRPDVAYSGVTARLLEQLERCSEEMRSRIFPSRWDIARRPYRRLAVNRLEVAHRSSSFGSSPIQVDDRVQRSSVDACLILELVTLQGPTRLLPRLET